MIAIIPFGIPGSGKSTFLNSLKQVCTKLSWSIASVSSDDIRKEAIDKLTSKGMARKEAFDKTSKSGPAEFNKRLE